jgi:hypothetical protein
MNTPARSGPDRDDEWGRSDVVRVAGPDGDTRTLRPGERLIFGRGPDVDILIGEDPWLSRRLGEILVSADGVRVTNLSRKSTLHVRTNTKSIKLQPASADADDIACVLSSGSALVGSPTMIDERRAVHVVLPERRDAPAQVPVPGTVDGGVRIVSTVPPLRLDRETKGFMVALLLCRPWLEDPARTAPLLSVPQIAIAALEVTNAHNLLAVARRDQNKRDALVNQIKSHISELRGKLVQRGFVPVDSSVGNTALASILIHYDIITRRDLELFDDDHWMEVQELKWWNTV